MAFGTYTDPRILQNRSPDLLIPDRRNSENRNQGSVDSPVPAPVTNSGLPIEVFMDLEQALKCLLEKRPKVEVYNAYYDGDVPTQYPTSQLREAFSKLNIQVRENWASLVIDSVADRIQMIGATVQGNDPANTAIGDLWRTLSLGVEADDVHEAALIASESFLIVWREEDGPIDACFHDARCVHLEYDPEHPKVKKFAFKVWKPEYGPYSNNWYGTLYYETELWYLTAPGKKSDPYMLPQASAWVPAIDPEYPQNPAPNPFQTIPVFHFKNKRHRSDLDPVIDIQNAINRLASNLLTASEYAALPQRYVISSADTSGLKNAPGRVWDLPAGDGMQQPTQAGQFEAADLSNYSQSISNLVQSLGAITRTPRHYFLAQGGDPSGEALIAMEAPLTKKARDRIARFVPEWRHALSFLLNLAGYPVTADQIEPTFAPVHTLQPMTEAQVRQLDVQIGIPLHTVLKRSGWSDQDIAQLEADRETERLSRAPQRVTFPLPQPPMNS